MELQFLFSVRHLIMLYICTKFRKNILNGFRVVERTQFVTARQTDTQLQTENYRKINMSPFSG